VVECHRFSPIGHPKVRVHDLGGPKLVGGRGILETVEKQDPAEKVTLSLTTSGGGEVDLAQPGVEVFACTPEDREAQYE
jgi:hypothetical protein